MNETPSTDTQSVPSDQTQTITTSTDEQAQVASPPTPAEPPESEAQRSRARERIEELVATNKVLREGYDYLRGQLQQQQVPQKVETDEQPRLEQFDHDVEKYQQANNAWLQRQIDKRASALVDQRLTQAQAERQQQQAAETYAAKAAEFKQTHPDYDVIVQNPALPFNGTLLKTVMKSEQSAAILYHLGNDVAKAVRIARMDPEAQGLALGRLEAELSKPAPPPRTTNAPPPPKPLGSGPSLAPDPSQMSAKDYLHMRLEAKHKRR